MTRPHPPCARWPARSPEPPAEALRDSGPGWPCAATTDSRRHAPPPRWRWTGYNAVILLAGLQTIKKEQYEAAALDGAGAPAAYTRVIFPQLRPVLLFCLITSTVGTLQLFDENYVLTRGGPADATLTPVLYLYRTGFQQMDFGYAAAIAWLVVAVIGALCLLQYCVLGRERR